MLKLNSKYILKLNSKYILKMAYKHLVILDFEATCDVDAIPRPQEIIEFPAIVINASSGIIISAKQIYVSPENHPDLSTFCTHLTGITTAIGMVTEKSFPSHSLKKSTGTPSSSLSPKPAISSGWIFCLMTQEI